MEEKELAHLARGSASSAPPPLSASSVTAVYGRNYYPATACAALAYLQHPPARPSPPSPISEEELKVKIMSHPQYPALVTAYIDCQKVGAPPDVAARLSAVAGELDQSRSSCPLAASSDDPELDQFLEAYCDMLVKYREEITRILEEATGFLERAESQFNAIADSASTMRLFVSTAEENYEGVALSDDDQDASCGGIDLPEDDRHPENDKELKLQLLKKYSGYLSSLRQQLSKKKKKGKLPKEARHKLLSWWELHYRWPYPSEGEKAALAESTGLDQKQINNWFINQRKRHWKPSEEMQFVMMEGFHPQNLSRLYMEGQFSHCSSYRPGA